MVVIGVINQEFLHHNANRSYPFAERATKTPNIGAQEAAVPNNFLVAAKIVVNATPEQVNVANFYISRLTVYHGGVNFIINYRGNEGDIKVGTVTAIDLGTHDHLNITVPIIALNNWKGLSGHVTVGTFEQVRSMLGDYSFDLPATQLDVDVVSFSSAAVTSITVIENGAAHAPIYGDIQIVAGENIKIDESYDNETQSTELRISRVINDVIERRRCIQTINMVPPDVDGNIAIVSHSPCLQVENDVNASTVVLTETCCDPCCGCEELSVIKQGIQNLLQANNEVRLYQQKLEQQLVQLASTFSVTGI